MKGRFVSVFGGLFVAVGLLTAAAGPASASALAPTIGASWQGVAQSGITPPDANGAVGPNSYIEVVNLQIGIYQRSGTLITSPRSPP